jgi:hypothetical protein
MSDDPRDPGPRHSSEPPQTEEERIAQGPAANVEPPGGMATSAGGGHGTGSDKQSSGGTGDAEHAAGEDPETDWLRRVNEGKTPAPVQSND